ncbi:MAG: ArsR family transcriptional regulator [Candidatus Heimdallarchaeota archaeon]|nr:ArsR family transcriptional regulator [Candidatus Heimdallarchaeota archaeon]MCK5144167.1 ArsR family transcriptional regulator [Candidatus Heimdallarchaeota archaeon]
MNKSEKIEVDYKKLKAQGKKILDRVNEVYKVETRYGIIMAINNFGSANIKKLAKILGKNEATIYHHLKDLTREPELLVVDNQKTRENKGIFYKLSKIAEKNFGGPPLEILETKMEEAYKRILEQTDEEIAQMYMKMISEHPDLGIITDKERRSIAYNHYLESMMLNNLETAEKAFKKRAKPMNENYPLGSISNFPLDMKISKPRHLFQILSLLTEIAAKFARLKEEIAEEMEKEKIPENQKIDIHYHVVGGEVAEFEFE